MHRFSDRKQLVRGNWKKATAAGCSVNKERAAGGDERSGQGAECTGLVYQERPGVIAL